MWHSARFYLLVLSVFFLIGCSQKPPKLSAPITQQVYSNISYGPLARQQLDVYLPQNVNANKRYPVVVYLHGGYWRSGSKNQAAYVGQVLAASGYIAVLPNYRLYPEVTFPSFVFDAAKALDWTYDTIAQYQGNRQQLFLMGHSSGAHIAAMLMFDEQFLASVNQNHRIVSGMIGLAGPYEFNPVPFGLLKPIFGPPERYELGKPVNFVKPGRAPLFLGQGENDWVIPRSFIDNMQAKVENAGISVEKRIYKNLSHNSVIQDVRRFNQSPVLTDIRRFINQQLAR